MNQFVPSTAPQDHPPRRSYFTITAHRVGPLGRRRLRVWQRHLSRELSEKPPSRWPTKPDFCGGGKRERETELPFFHFLSRDRPFPPSYFPSLFFIFVASFTLFSALEVPEHRKQCRARRKNAPSRIKLNKKTYSKFPTARQARPFSQLKDLLRVLNERFWASEGVFSFVIIWRAAPKKARTCRTGKALFLQGKGGV